MLFTEGVKKSLLWIFLFAWPLAAMVFFLWTHSGTQSASLNENKWSLLLTVGIFAVYYPAIVVYAITHILHSHIKSRYSISLPFWFMLITPATMIGIYVGAAYLDFIQASDPFSNNIVLFTIFGYYPLIFISVILKALWHYMEEQTMKAELIIKSHG